MSDSQNQSTLTGLLQRIRMREATLREFGIDRLSIFGSHARGTATSESDVDVLVHFPSEHRGGYFDMARVKRTLEDDLGLRVDVQLEDCVPSKSTVLHESVRAF